MSDTVTAVRTRTDQLKVFVSYSRVDSTFADEIEAGLEYDGGFDVLIDRHDIHEGEEWKKRLGALIAQADTIVFVLSRASAASPICRWEVEQAKALSKRIVPIQTESLGGLDAPPALAALNYVRFDENRSFMAGLAGLRRALKTDIDWLREHTRLLTRAQEWQTAKQLDNRLLTGVDIEAAKFWLDRSPADGPAPTDLHRDFIQASDRAETLRLSAERERADRLERAIKRTRAALWVAVALACVAGALGLYAKQQQHVAEEAKQKADSEAKHAEDSAAFATAESQRADEFVTLVSQDPAGQRAMEKICLEATGVTSTLATTTDRGRLRQARDRFLELYFASMYIVELHERKMSPDNRSRIEGAMVRFEGVRSALESSNAPLPHKALCTLAKEVRDQCNSHLQLTAPEPCR